VTPGYVLSDYPAGYPIKNCQWGRTSGSHLFVFYNKSLNFAVLFIASCSSLKRSSRIRITASSSEANVMFLCMRTQHLYPGELRILNLIAFIWLIPWLSTLVFYWLFAINRIKDLMLRPSLLSTMRYSRHSSVGIVTRTPGGWNVNCGFLFSRQAQVTFLLIEVHNPVIRSARNPI